MPPLTGPPAQARSRKRSTCHRARAAGERRPDDAEHRHRAPFELVVAVDARQAEQAVREHRVTGRDRAVVEILRPGDELLSVYRGHEEAAAVVVREQLDGEQRQAPRLLEPAQLAGRDVQLVEAVRDVGVVVEERRIFGFALAKRPPERIRGEQLTELEGRGQEVRALEPAGALRQRRERKAVPRRDHLVVERGLWPAIADLEQPRARLFVHPAAENRAPVFEGLQEFRRRPLLRSPRVRQPLDAVRVRVL